MITIEPFNLKNNASYEKYKNVDFIFCRNVLFYFDEPVVQQIINGFYRVLHDEGILFLGHAESISNLKTNFQTFYTKNTFYYTKGL
jgi:chemotaxis protein methyltransferase CheR